MINRRLHPGLVRNPEFSLCRSVKNPYGLNQVIVLNRSSHTRIGAKFVYPGTIVQQRARLGRHDAEIYVRIWPCFSARMRTAQACRYNAVIALRPTSHCRYEFVWGHR